MFAFSFEITELVSPIEIRRIVCKNNSINQRKTHFLFFVSQNLFYVIIIEKISLNDRLQKYKEQKDKKRYKKFSYVSKIFLR